MIATHQLESPEVDWGALGSYEHVAPSMAPAAQAMIEFIAPGAEDRVLDTGTGTGSAALLAAARGAIVTGIDPSEKLIEIARREAAQQGLDVTFVPGKTTALPFADASFDVIIDNFSLIFVGDPSAAVREMARVLAPGGRIVWSAWTSSGTIVDWVKASNAAVASVLGKPLYDYSAWYDPTELERRFEPHGFDVVLEEHSLRYEAPSIEEWMEAVAGAHPLVVAGNRILEQAGQLKAVNAQLKSILAAGNEAVDGFAVSPRYVIGTATRRA